ncbi:MAG: hypothetical protein ACKO7Q_11000 [Actinomycetota bacterium]
MRRSLAVLAVCVAALLAPLGAHAATRYAAPTGAGPEPCAEAAPCALTAALGGGLADGDTVILLGRTTGAASSLYDLTALPGRVGVTIARRNVTVTAREDGVTIRSNSRDEAVRAPAGGVVLRRLVLQNVCGSPAPLDPAPADCTAGFPAYALRAGSATVERVFAYSSQRRACAFLGEVAVANTVCLALNGTLASELSNPCASVLVNVTARARYAPAVEIVNLGAGACPAASVTLASTLISAQQAGLVAPLEANRPGVANPCPLTLTLRASSVPTRAVGMSVTLVEEDPVTAAPAYQDVLRIVPSAASPTVNRGSTNPADRTRAGIFDLTSRERVQGGRIDVGAYELSEGAPPPAAPVEPADAANAGVAAPDATPGVGAQAGAATALRVLRARATARPRAIVVRGRVVAPAAGVVTRTVARVQGRRQIVICRVRQAVAAGATDLRCTTRPAARALLRRRALVLVVTTRFTATGATSAAVDRQNLRLRRR